MPYKDKDKQREYQRNWMRERREAFFKGKVCVNCGADERLELDHIDRDTKVSHNVWSWSEQRRLEELDKCQVLCEDCHMAKTIEQMDRSPHGTHNRYVSGCRCQPCKKAHSISTTQWKSRQGHVTLS